MLPALIADQFEPPSVEYCHVPFVVSTAVTAMPFTAPASPSVKFVTNADTSVPGLLPLTTSSTIDVTVLAAATGASFTAVKLIVLVVLAESVPSLTAVVSVRLVVLFEAPWYVIFPAVVKYVFRSAIVPAKVRAVAVPPNAMPVLAAPVIVPSATESVTVRAALSASAKGVPE